MPKLKKFKGQKEKKVSTKNLFIAFGIILMIMGGVIISKSYAIYKLEKKYDIIQSKIGTFSKGDVRVAVMVDGKEANEFPSYETNYKVEQVKCSNDVQGEWDGQWDTKNWRLIIDDMSATSTKCTVYFNSQEQNSETPIAYSKEELLALNEEIKNMAYEQMKTQLLNDTYPIGSIYMSTTEDSVEKVQAKFGGTWVKYSEGRTLVGVGSNGTSTYKVEQKGGAETHKHIAPIMYVSTPDGTKAIFGTTNDLGLKTSSFNSLFGTEVNVVADFKTSYSNYTQKTVYYTSSEKNVSPYTAVYMYKRKA